MTVNAGGAVITSGKLVVTDTVNVASGALSVTSTSTSATLLDVAPSHASYTGNAFQSRVSAGSFGANVFVATEGTNTLFQVPWFRC